MSWTVIHIGVTIHIVKIKTQMQFTKWNVFWLMNQLCSLWVTNLESIWTVQTMLDHWMQCHHWPLHIWELGPLNAFANEMHIGKWTNISLDIPFPIGKKVEQGNTKDKWRCESRVTHSNSISCLWCFILDLKLTMIHVPHEGNMHGGTATLHKWWSDSKDALSLSKHHWVWLSLQPQWLQQPTNTQTNKRSPLAVASFVILNPILTVFKEETFQDSWHHWKHAPCKHSRSSRFLSTSFPSRSLRHRGDFHPIVHSGAIPALVNYVSGLSSGSNFN